MATFGTRYLPQHPLPPAFTFPAKGFSLIDAPSNFLLSFASSFPASSHRSLRYVLRRHSASLFPSRASHAGNLVDGKTQKEPNLAKQGRCLVGRTEQDAISSTSISANEWAEMKLRTRKGTVNGKTEGNRGNKHEVGKGSKDHTRKKQKYHRDFPSSPSKESLVSRDAAVKKIGPDKHIEGEAARERKVTNFMSVQERSGAINGKKSRDRSPGFELRVQLDMCSKKGDVVGAMSLYDSAVKEGIRLQQYHYNVLLYLCSSAAVGVVYPGKSGNSNSGKSPSSLTDFICSTKFAAEDRPDNFSEQTDENGALLSETESGNEENISIRVSEDVRNLALIKGFEIYEKMCEQTISMNEAALTSVARMAMATDNGDLAFEIVKKIKNLGLSVRLRSYAPVLFSYCNNGEIVKAFEVERHMLDSGIQPEEPELAALLKVSIEANKSDKVYYLLQKLRASVRQVSPSTAELIEKWFKSPTASKVGKRKWNSKHIAQAIENGGGGWHGLGWLGKGKWIVTRGNVDDNGMCMSCGGKLVAVDIDPVETENFAKSVASIAAKRDRNSSFQMFQKWLDYYGPFEAVIDAANVGLYSQRLFSVVKVNAVVNGVRQKLPSKKWPLIVLHNRRVYGGKTDKPVNNKLMEKWKNADAVYATPTGSNDDWYWLYAAVKCKSLIVTNDEMRDHNFQLLGNDFFPKWKERHQVRFTFKDGNPEFYMPPACSTIIQESEKGDWHVPISEQASGTKRTWLCIRRHGFDSPHNSQVSEPLKGSVPRTGKLSTHNDHHLHIRSPHHSGNESLSNAERLEIVKILKKIVIPPKKMERHTVASDLEVAEKISGYVIDFQI